MVHHALGPFTVSLNCLVVLTLVAIKGNAIYKRHSISPEQLMVTFLNLETIVPKGTGIFDLMLVLKYPIYIFIFVLPVNVCDTWKTHLRDSSAHVNC